jgi:hypothetical protein
MSIIMDAMDQINTVQLDINKNWTKSQERSFKQHLKYLKKRNNRKAYKMNKNMVNIQSTLARQSNNLWDVHWFWQLYKNIFELSIMIDNCLHLNDVNFWLIREGISNKWTFWLLYVNLCVVNHIGEWETT